MAMIVQSINQLAVNTTLMALRDKVAELLVSIEEAALHDEQSATA
ncbi:MAG: hypothetical protein ACI9HK_004915 [Pirellulaceae bacterium]|jgi:hypothetical protein